ncbi:MAG: A/G-specific adenine glycosylase [Candidatus Latescibacteria bacterium]|nr:A/G-specific adenine glycosylase [Candidatus Latescibacterota bacterium]
MTVRTRNDGTDRRAAADALALRRDLLAWYDRERRPLPWRERPSAYGIWVSEVMLQQTTVAVVMTRWRAFLDRFPDQASLAAAPLEDVLAAWSGLGYYRRARSLHAAARIVMASGGELPRDAAGWRTLPGVGPYTAGAVASMACGERVAAVDTNVARVLRRLHCRDAAAANDLTGAALDRLAAELVDPVRPGDWNQALMDLGAAICAPAAPDCAACPLAQGCLARLGGEPGAVAGRQVGPGTTAVSLSLLVVRAGRGLVAVPPGSATPVHCRGLGAPVRDGFAGLYEGLWGLPSTSWYGSGGADPRETFAAAWRDVIPVGAVAPEHRGVFRHAITRYRLRVDVFESGLGRDGSLPAGWVRCGPGRLAAIPWSSLAHKALRRAGVPIEI